MAATPPPYAPNVQDQTVDYGGVTWKGQPGGGWHAQSATGGGAVDASGNPTYDPVNTAKQLIELQKTANAPVVTALQGQKGGIEQQYSQLVDSIKQNQQVSANSATLATNNELGARGISNTSGLYNQEMNKALLPVNAAYSGQLAQANTGSIQDLQNLAVQIANLQAGNPSQSIQLAPNYAQVAAQSSLIPSQIAASQAQAGLASAQGGYYGILGSLLSSPGLPNWNQFASGYNG